MLQRARPAFLPSDVVFESFTYPFFDLNFDANHELVARAFLERPDTRSNVGLRGLYVHIPFCDTICSFCPFIKSVGSEERISRYLQALDTESAIISKTGLASSWGLDAIYIGGGTPSVLSIAQATSLISMLKDRFQLKAGVEVTFEVEAKSATRELFEAVRTAGATRVSFGTQTTSPALRSMVNLTASMEQIHSTIDQAKFVFGDVNMDMIVGFPGQSTEEAVEDMHRAANLGATSVSLYPMDYIMVQARFLDRIKSGSLPRPTTGRARWELFHSARAALLRHYTEQNMYCFGSPNSSACRYMFHILYGGYDDQCLGLGCGAYSMFRGLAYINTQSETDYVGRMREGRLAVARSSPGHAYEKTFVYFPKRLSANLNEADRLGISSNVLPKVEALVADGLVTVEDESVKLTPRGLCEYSQIMVGFLPDHQRRLYDRACADLTAKLGWGVAGPVNNVSAKLRGFGARSALTRATM